MDAVEALSRNLLRAQGGLVLHPSEYFQTNIRRAASCMAFITSQVGAVGNDSGHVVPNGVGPVEVHLYQITADFEYSVRILALRPGRPHPVEVAGKWHQIVGVKGPGSLTLRRLTVPPDTDIASFQPGVVLGEADLVSAANGDVLASQSRHQLLDILRCGLSRGRGDSHAP